MSYIRLYILLRFWWLVGGWVCRSRFLYRLGGFGGNHFGLSMAVHGTEISVEDRFKMGIDYAKEGVDLWCGQLVLNCLFLRVVFGPPCLVQCNPRVVFA